MENPADPPITVKMETYGVSANNPYELFHADSVTSQRRRIRRYLADQSQRRNFVSVRNVENVHRKNGKKPGDDAEFAAYVAGLKNKTIKSWRGRCPKNVVDELMALEALSLYEDMMVLLRRANKAQLERMRTFCWVDDTSYSREEIALSVVKELYLWDLSTLESVRDRLSTVRKLRAHLS